LPDQTSRDGDRRAIFSHTQTFNMCVGGDPLGLGGGAYFFYLHFGQKAVVLVFEWEPVSGIKKCLSALPGFGDVMPPLIQNIYQQAKLEPFRSSLSPHL
jgi:hypothetical protein